MPWDLFYPANHFEVVCLAVEVVLALLGVDDDLVGVVVELAPLG